MTELSKAIWTNPLVALEFAVAAVYFAIAVCSLKLQSRCNHQGNRVKEPTV
jgi:hypothetical protein